MVRERKTPRVKGNFDAVTMKEGVQRVLQGESIRTAAKNLNLKYSTLARYVKKFKNNPETGMKARYDTRKVFSDEQEENLVKFLINNAKMFYGFSTIDARKLAYQSAKLNNITCPENWKKNCMAGKDWLYGFMKRHSRLSLRTAEGCSLAKAMSFNRYNVNMFFDNLEDIMSKCPELRDPSRIWNFDETKTETTQRPSCVIAEKGIKQVSKAITAERGTLVTTTLIINAAGNTIPPVMVFPRVHFKDHILQGAPSGTLGLAYPSGWMNSTNFVQFMKHFINYSGSSKTRQMLLICDNHESHLCLEAINLARANGVHILTVPPHSTHRMQPLDVGLMKPFQTYYNAAVDSWMSSNPGKSFTIYNVAACVGIAHARAMTPENIINSFRKTGIFPTDKHVYTDDMFLPSLVTDRSSLLSEDSAQKQQPNNKEPFASSSATFNQNPRVEEASQIVDNSSSDTLNYKSPEVFRGYPKAKPNTSNRKSRAKGKSRIITSSPEKSLLEEKQKIKVEKEVKQKSSRASFTINNKNPKKQRVV